MNTAPELTPPWQLMLGLANSQDAPALEALIESIGPAEAFRALVHLTTNDREKILTTLTPAEAADLIEEIPDEHAADLIEQLPVEDAASIIAEMPSADQADVLSELNDKNVEAILAVMEPEVASDARQLISYSGDVAGGLMATQFISFDAQTSVGDAIDQMSELVNDEAVDDASIYVVSRSGKLRGSAILRQLFMTPLKTK
ncbi:MAG: hypothetical protein OER96_12410, partial [Gammaproteobacteria bacterium]|nr:hypothetical protein [Gammaproteobacteria bacterium]